jgi:hypothetical protein
MNTETKPEIATETTHDVRVYVVLGKRVDEETAKAGQRLRLEEITRRVILFGSGRGEDTFPSPQ